jgi:hypothetical protein
MKLIGDGCKHLWSLWAAGFWGFIGALVVILSALFYQAPDWKIGAALIAASISIAIARVLKQPGTES